MKTGLSAILDVFGGYLFPPSKHVFQHGQERQNTTKIGQFAVKYHVFVIVPRQICSYIF